MKIVASLVVLAGLLQVVHCASASASASSSLLETVWSLEGLVSAYPTQRDPILIASNLGIVAVTDEEGTVSAVEANNGTVLWSTPRPPCCGPKVQNKTAEDHYFLTEMHFIGDPLVAGSQELLLVHYLPPFILEHHPFGILKLPNILKIFNISSGEMVKQVEIPFGSIVAHNADSYIVMAQAHYSSPFQVNRTKISPTNGSLELKWSTNLPVSNSQGSFSVSDASKLYVGNDVAIIRVTAPSRVTNSSHEFALSLDMEEGQIVCVAPLRSDSGFPPPKFETTGNVVKGINLKLDKQPDALYAMAMPEDNNYTPRPYQTPFYPWAICAIPGVPSMEAEKNVTFIVSGDHFYGLNSINHNLTQINGTTGAIDWTSTVAVYNKGTNNYTKQVAVYPEAHDPRYYFAVIDGAINVIEKHSGIVVLGLSQYFFPHSPVDARRQLLFLLSPEGTSNQKFLLPNLMGWNIFESTTGFPIVETEQQSPISAPLTFLNPTTQQPYLIWIDFNTVTLQCVRMKL